MFCCTLLYVPSSFAIILLGKRELAALLSLFSWCLVIVLWLFLSVPWVCLQLVIVVFSDHTHLLFLVQFVNLTFLFPCEVRKPLCKLIGASRIISVFKQQTIGLMLLLLIILNLYVLFVIQSFFVCVFCNYFILCMLFILCSMEPPSLWFLMFCSVVLSIDIGGFLSPK